MDLGCPNANDTHIAKAGFHALGLAVVGRIDNYKRQTEILAGNACIRGYGCVMVKSETNRGFSLQFHAGNQCI